MSNSLPTPPTSTPAKIATKSRMGMLPNGIVRQRLYFAFIDGDQASNAHPTRAKAIAEARKRYNA